MWEISAATPVHHRVRAVSSIDAWGRLTWSSTDIVESELSNTRVELEEEGQRLANSTGGTENGDLGELELKKSAIEAEIMYF